MNKLLKYSAIASVCALLGCGGQVTAKPVNICMQPSDRLIAMKDCDATLWPTPEADPVKSAAMQASLGPHIIGWIGGDNAPDKVTAQAAITKTVMERAPRLLAEMAKYPNIEWVYAQDEVGWCDTQTCLYDYLPQLAELARLTHAAGKKVLVSMPTGVLTQYPDAPAAGINQIDGIVFDIYPSIPLPGDFGNCTYNANPYSTILKCSVERIRRMGFTGAIVLAVQGFRMKSDDPVWLRNQLALQREMIASATALGVDAISVFGCHRDEYIARVVPDLIPLCGTEWEKEVLP